MEVSIYGRQSLRVLLVVDETATHAPVGKMLPPPVGMK